jgi:hypothetical protein
MCVQQKGKINEIKHETPTTGYETHHGFMADLLPCIHGLV